MAYEKLLNEITAVTTLKYFWRGYHEGYVKWESPDWLNRNDDIGIEVSQALFPRDGKEESFLETYLGRPKEELPAEAFLYFGSRLYFYNNRFWALLDDSENDVDAEEKIVARFRAKLRKLNTNYRLCAVNALYLFTHTELKRSAAKRIEYIFSAIAEEEEHLFDIVFLDCISVLYLIERKKNGLSAVAIPEKARRFLNDEAEKTRADFDDALGTPFR